MCDLHESYVLTFAPELSLTAGVVDRLLAWAQLHGHAPSTTDAWRLPLTEGIVNAINHGCHGQENACIRTECRLHPDGLEFHIRDPGHFVPSPQWSQLPPDPLAEHGRGGFLIAQSTPDWRHENDATGHTLILGWRSLPALPADLTTAAQTPLVIENLTSELANAYEMISGYAHLVGLLATARDFADLLHGVRARLANVVPHSHFVLRFIEGDRLHLAPGFSPAPFPSSVSLTATVLEARVATSGRFATVNSALQLALDDPLHPAAGSLVVLPVAFANKIFGTLTVAALPNGTLYTAGQIELLQSVADFLGIAYSTDQLYRSREGQLRLQQEITIAADIQRMLLPQHMPDIAGWVLSGDCRPARQVGGDYYDFISRADGSCLVVIADVMGKGIPAALVASMLRTALRAQATASDSPGEMLTRLNQQMGPDLAMLEVFITVVLLVIPAKGGTLRYANAGHCAPLLMRPTAPVYELGGGDMPLGVLLDAVVTDHVAELPLGSTLFVFTDGCFEWRRSNGSFLGSNHFGRTLEEHAADNTPHLVRQVLDEITRQAGPAGLPDDCTLVAIQYQG